MRTLAIVTLVLGLLASAWIPARAADTPAAERIGSISADKLNLRGSPSTTGEIVGSMVRGDKVTILGEQGEWFQLQLADGRTGWAAAKYIQVEAPAVPAAKDDGEPRHSEGARESVQPRAQTSEAGGGGGGSALGAVLKWGCLLGAGACGYLAYSEHTDGNDSYDAYKTEYNRLVLTGSTPQAALDGAEPLRVEAEDHDSKANTYVIVAGALGAAFLVQELFLGNHGDDSATLEDRRAPEPPLVACQFGPGGLRAAVTLARF